MFQFLQLHVSVVFSRHVLHAFKMKIILQNPPFFKSCLLFSQSQNCLRFCLQGVAVKSVSGKNKIVDLFPESFPALGKTSLQEFFFFVKSVVFFLPNLYSIMLFWSDLDNEVLGYEAKFFIHKAQKL